jgi:hypothetical protein
MKLLLIFLIGYLSDCCALKAISRKELQENGLKGIEAATQLFIDTTVLNIYQGVIDNSKRGDFVKSYTYQMNPSDDLLYHAKINYWAHIIDKLKTLFPDCEVADTNFKGIAVYWG